MFTEEYTRILQYHTKLCQYFGLAPLTKLRESSDFYTSPSKFTVSIMYNLLQLTHAIYQVNKIRNEIHMSTMSAIIHFIWMFQCLLTNLLVSSQSLLVSKYLVTYLNQLSGIDNEIRLKLQIIPNYQRQNENHFRLMIFVFLMLLATWILYGSLAFTYPELISLFVFVFFPTVFMSIRVFQIVHSIELLNDYLNIINGTLNSISSELNEIRGNHKKISTISNDLITLSQIYSRCWCAMQSYNRYFGFSNCMLLLFYSYDLLHGIHNLFLNMYGLRPDLVPLYGFCCLPSAINLFIITYAAVRCRNKSKETGILLGKIWSLQSCHVPLKRFSLQVIHQQFPMTACGLLIADFEFLGGITIGFSNLLLLFIQFEISEKRGK